MNRNDEWKLPLNLAIGFHIMVALSAIYLPHLFESKPQFTDIYTVNLINMAEPAAAPAPAAPVAPATPATPPQPAVKTPPKVIEKAAAPVKIPVKPAAPIAEEKPAEEIAPPAPPKAISLKPLKRKIKNKIVPPDDTVQREMEKREKEVERQKRQQLAESLKDEQATTEDARIATEELEAARKEMEASQQQLSQIRSQASSATGSQSSQATQSGGTSNALSAKYAADIKVHVQPFFQLPEIKTFDPSLKTVVAITININGEIADAQIETGSGDAIYDQFVLKSIEAANPLPPIPPAMRKQRIISVTTFTPSGIQ
ncbi:MAG: cell envelope integrity protein TolA [Desulfoprunum sp.]|nr:cell envelope integrity protein TolA [Desulfoprunum sp.]